MEKRKVNSLALATALFTGLFSTNSINVNAGVYYGDIESLGGQNPEDVYCSLYSPQDILNFESNFKNEDGFSQEKPVSNEWVDKYYLGGIDGIIAVVKNEYSELNKEWKAEDFGVDNAIYVQDLTAYNAEDKNTSKFIYTDEYIEYLQSDSFHQYIQFDLKDGYPQTAKLAIEALENSGMVLAITAVWSVNTTITYGDINSDGSIDLTDLTELSLALIGDKEFTDTQNISADTTKDGNTNLADLARLKQYISLDITSFD